MLQGYRRQTENEELRVRKLAKGEDMTINKKKA